LYQIYIIQLVTGIEVTLEIVPSKFGLYCPTPKAEGNISLTEGKQFPIVTDYTSHCLFCYTL